MRQGGGKQKGAQFEREICQRLSLWVSHGKSKDCFWRSAMSGGRATLGRRKGIDLARQAGDITAVAPEGHALTDLFYVECKFYKDLNFGGFFIKQNGSLFDFWAETCVKARSEKRFAMLIAKQNMYPSVMLVTPQSLFSIVVLAGMPQIEVNRPTRSCEVWLLDDVLKAPFK